MARIAERLPLRHARTLFAAVAVQCAAHAMATPSPSAAPTYTLSAPFNELRRAGVPAWEGEHRFGKVFCLRVPDPAEGTALAETFFNDNTLYFRRVEYPARQINLYVVSSRLPAQLDPPAEHAEQDADAIEALEAFVDRAAASLAECTAALAVRTP